MTRVMHNLMMLTLFLTTCYNHATIIYKGNNDASVATFTFPIGSYIYTPRIENQPGLIFIGSSNNTAENYSLTGSTFVGNIFRPLAPEKITLNKITSSNNPLFNAQINYLAQIANFPIAVTNAEPSTIYFLNTGTFEEISTIVQDAQESPASSIVGITSNSPLGHANAYTQVITAVAPNAGVFGDTGSGITYIPVQKEVVVIPPATKGARETTRDDYTFGDQSSLPLDVTTPEMYINSPAAAFNPTAHLKYDGTLAGLFVGLQVTGNVGINDGVRSVVFVKNGVRAITPTTAIGADSIIGATGSSVEVSVHGINVMYTSSGLFYLIIWGGVGSPAATAQTVYALPLVTLGAFAGTLANVNSAPLEVYSTTPPYTFTGRGFNQPALVPGDLYTPADIQAVVGNNTALPSAITSMYVQNDTVFVSCQSNGANQKAGIFSSQAIFNDTAKIIGWTDWKRVAGSQEPTNGVIFDTLTGEIIFMTGDTIATINTVKRTEWTQENAIASTVTNAYATSTSKVQGLWDFPSYTPGFDQTLGNQIAVTIATGYNQALVMQTGSDAVGNLFGPDAPQDIFEAPQGSLAGFVGGKAINFTQLDSLGAITSAAFAFDGSNCWLVVGGTGGIGILAEQDGSGASLIGNNFSGITSTMSLKQFPIANNIRKISAIGNNLFILTTNELLRISLTKAGIANNNLNAYTLTSTSNELFIPGSSFSDFIVAGPLALLATSQGLYRSGNDVDVQTVTSTNNMLLTKINLNESVGPATRLFAITNDYLESSLTEGGMVYVLNSYIGYDQARIYRLSVQPFVTVSDQTVQNFPDYFIQGRKTFYLNYGNYQNYFFTDGAMLYSSRSAYKPFKTPPYLKVLGMAHTFERFIARNAVIVLHPSPFISMGRLINLSGAGVLAVHGDFGLYIQG